MYFIIGLTITALFLIFVVAPAFIAIFFDYTSTTYLGQVKLGLYFMSFISLVVLFVVVFFISIEFAAGNFDVIRELQDKLATMMK